MRKCIDVNEIVDIIYYKINDFDFGSLPSLNEVGDPNNDEHLLAEDKIMKLNNLPPPPYFPPKYQSPD